MQIIITIPDTEYTTIINDLAESWGRPEKIKNPGTPPPVLIDNPITKEVFVTTWVRNWFKSQIREHRQRKVVATIQEPTIT